MSLDALFEELKHPNPNLRDRASLEIAAGRDETTVPRLMGLIDHENVDLRRSAVKTLGVIGADAVPALTRGLTSESVAMRTSCCKALAQLAANFPEDALPDATIAALKAGTGDENAMVQLVSVMALGQLGQAGFGPLTEVLRENDDAAVGVAIVNALGSGGDERSIAVLQALTMDETVDSYVRESAVSALPRLDQMINYKKSGW